MRRRGGRTAVALAACRDCGDIQLEVASITLVILDGILLFDCPDCGKRLERPSPIHAEECLIAAGCQVVVS